MNLISFRRKLISKKEYELLNNAYIKYKSNEEYSQAESSYIKYLKDQKQIIDCNNINEYQQKLESYYLKCTPKVRAISINVTNKCNFRCYYCYQRRDYDRSIKLTVSDIVKIKDYLYHFLSNYGIECNLSDIFISGGEPILTENISTINSVLDNLASENTRVKLYTNGVNIIKCSKLIDFSRIKKYQISLDGLDNVIRKVNKINDVVFIDIIDGIKYLADMNAEINIPIMLIPECVDDLDNLITVLEREGLLNHSNINFSLTTALDRTKNSVVDLSIYDLEQYLQLRSKARSIIKGTKISLGTIPELATLLRYLQRNKNQKVIGMINGCANYESIPLMFSPDKNVYWCSCEKADVGVVGKFDQVQTLNEELLKQYLKRNIFTCSKCKNCSFRFVCAAGCVLASTAQGNSVMQEYCGALSNQYVLDHLEEFLF